MLCPYTHLYSVPCSNAKKDRAVSLFTLTAEYILLSLKHSPRRHPHVNWQCSFMKAVALFEVSKEEEAFLGCG